jgi:hypothetical protein
VPEQALHLLNRGAAREAKRGEGVPEVVEPKPMTAGRPSELSVPLNLQCG